MSQGAILIVDDDGALLETLPEMLRLRMKGVTIETAASAETALARIDQREYDAIVTDIKMPGMDGLELLTEVRTRRPDIPTLMITCHADTELIVSALRAGACDFIRKPINREYLVDALRRAIQLHQSNRRAREKQLALERHIGELEAQVEQRKEQLRRKEKIAGASLSWMEGSTGQMLKVVQQIKQVAASPLTVLIEGETGTGKELAARAIHQLSGRREEPFIAMDCGAIPETLIESELFGYEKGAFTGAYHKKEGQFQRARGGTLFLDEIGNLPLATQAKLLRTLQQREVQPLGSTRTFPVSVRIIAASNVALADEVSKGRFRSDVYYRLNEFVITLPPLRERDNVLALANSLLMEAAVELDRPCSRLSEPAAEILVRYSWPGNVRELRNVIRRACLVASDTIEPEHLSIAPTAPGPSACRAGPMGPGVPAAGSSLKELAELAALDAEGQAIRLALQATGGNKSEAARLLRVDYKTLHLKMKRSGIEAGSFRSNVTRIT